MNRKTDQPQRAPSGGLEDFGFARLREIERIERRIALIERCKRPAGAMIEALALAIWYLMVRLWLGVSWWAILIPLILLMGAAQRVGYPLILLSLDRATQRLRARQSELRDEHRRLVRGYPPRNHRT